MDSHRAPRIAVHWRSRVMINRLRLKLPICSTSLALTPWTRVPSRKAGGYSGILQDMGRAVQRTNCGETLPLRNGIGIRRPPESWGLELENGNLEIGDSCISNPEIPKP